jgi:hypothetical protein
MGSPQSMLRLWLRVWMVVFALGAVDFLVFPTVTLAVLNSAGNLFGMPAIPARVTEFWAVLAVAYMVLVAAFCWEATNDPGIDPQPVRFLILGKTASSLVSLLYFIVVVHAFAFLANFLVDGFIAAGTYVLLRREVQAVR